MVEKVISSGEFGKNPLEEAVLDYITGTYAEETPELHWLNFQKSHRCTQYLEQRTER